MAVFEDGTVEFETREELSQFQWSQLDTSAYPRTEDISSEVECGAVKHVKTEIPVRVVDSGRKINFVHEHVERVETIK